MLGICRRFIEFARLILSAKHTHQPRPTRLSRSILIFGLIAGVTITVMRLIEYRWLVVSHSVEIYGGLVAAVFAGVGIWLGQRITGRKERIVVRKVEVPIAVPVEIPVAVPVEVTETFTRNEQRVAELGITPRELEILEKIAEGLSNREIADRLFVSENTVKTHAKRLFDKLGARRRTQAVQIGKAAGLIE